MMVAMGWASRGMHVDRERPDRKPNLRGAGEGHVKNNVADSNSLFLKRFRCHNFIFLWPRLW